MTDKQKRTVRDMLRGFGLRCTPGRKTLLDILLRQKKPLSQEQIAKKLHRRRQHLNKATIYRALETFVDLDLVHRAYLQDRVWYYELSRRCSKKQCHPHFTCTACGSMFCLPDVRVPLAKGLDKDFVLQRQQVRLEGLCPKCKR